MRLDCLHWATVENQNQNRTACLCRLIRWGREWLLTVFFGSPMIPSEQTRAVEGPLRNSTISPSGPHQCLSSWIHSFSPKAAIHSKAFHVQRRMLHSSHGLLVCFLAAALKDSLQDHYILHLASPSPALLNPKSVQANSTHPIQIGNKHGPNSRSRDMRMMHAAKQKKSRSITRDSKNSLNSRMQSEMGGGEGQGACPSQRRRRALHQL